VTDKYSAVPVAEGGWRGEVWCGRDEINKHGRLLVERLLQLSEVELDTKWSVHQVGR